MTEIANNKPMPPRHVAIIMDGNGRWATARHLPRTMGHKQGVKAVKAVVEAAGNEGIRYLTLFGFSAENWSRPDSEIKELMNLLRFYLRGETSELHKNNIKLNVVGDRSRFDVDIVEMIENVEALTVENTAMTLTIALNYGGQQDIANAAAVIAAQAAETGVAPTADDVFAQLPSQLMTADLPAPDLLIRTSGEQRISNFMLWQCAYSEMVFTPVLWPDFGADDLRAAIDEYAGRERRFGNVAVLK